MHSMNGEGMWIRGIWIKGEVKASGMSLKINTMVCKISERGSERVVRCKL